MSRFSVTSKAIFFFVLALFGAQLERLGADTSQDKSLGCKKVNSSFLWMIERDPPAFLFGTVHVPYKSVWPNVAPVVKRTFNRISDVFFELDLTDPYTMSALTRCQLLPPKRHLNDYIPYSMYVRIEKHLDYVRRMIPVWMSPDQRIRESSPDQNRLYAEYLYRSMTRDWQRKRPVWVMLMLNSLTEMDVRNRGVPVLDLFLAQEAHRRNKRSGALEDVPEQCEPLNRLNLSQVIFALNITLTHHEMKRNMRISNHFVDSATMDLIKHYNCGNLSAVLFQEDNGPVHLTAKRLLLPPQQQNLIRQIDNYFRAELIDKRNGRMAERVQTIISQDPNTPFFFALGAGHFIGEKTTVIDHLRNAGFRIKQLPRNHPGPDFRHLRKDRPRPFVPMVSTDGHPSLNIQQHLDFFKPNSRNQFRKKLPEFRPKYVHFRDLWIRIEDFTQKSIKEDKLKVHSALPPSRRQLPHGSAAPIGLSFHLTSLVPLWILLTNAFTIRL